MAKRPTPTASSGERLLSPPISGGTSDVAVQQQRRASAQLFSLSNQGQDMLDEIAVEESTVEGTIAGRDINGFRPRRDKTLSARAFNRAGLRSFQSELEIQGRKKLQEFSEQFGNDPAKLDDAIRGYQAGIEGQLEEQFPEAVGDFRATYERLSAPVKQRAADEHLRVQESQAAAKSLEFLDGLQEGAENIAFNTTSDVEATNALAEERQRLIGELVEYGPKQGFEIDGHVAEPDIDRLEVYTPEQMQKILAAFDTQMISKRILGKFERAASKEAFLNKFQARLGKADRVEGLTIDDTNRLAATMRQGVQAERSDRAAAVSALKNDVKGAIKLLEKGRSPRGLAKLRGDVAGTELEGPLEAAVVLADYSLQVREATPAALDVELEHFDKNPPTTMFEQARFEIVEKTKKEMETGLKNDPLAWADDSGGMDIEPLDFRNIETLPDQLAGRMEQVERVNLKYGIQAPAFTDTEANQVAQAWGQATGVERMGIAQILVNSMDGESASRTLATLDKKHASSFAMMGELLSAGQQNAAMFMSSGMDNIAADKDIIPTGTGNNLDEEARAYVGNVYSASPRHQQVVLEGAKNIYAGMSAAAGDRSGILDPARMQTAVDMASGGIIDYRPPETTKIPGFRADFRRTVAPAPGVTGDQFAAWLGTIDVNDVNRWGNVAGFKPATVAENIRTGAWQLVSRGAGRYVVQAETLETGAGEFRPLKRRDGKGLFVIDFNDTGEKFDPFRLESGE